ARRMADKRHGHGWEVFTIHGKYYDVQRPWVLEFTRLADWDDGAGQSLVRFDLEEKDGTTTVRLTHSGHQRTRPRELSGNSGAGESHATRTQISARVARTGPSGCVRLSAPGGTKDHPLPWCGAS